MSLVSGTIRAGGTMRPVNWTIAAALGRPELVRGFEARQAYRDWHEVVGEFLAQQSQPDGFRDGVLYVATTGSAWVQELTLRKAEILARLRERTYRKNLFKDIRFGVRPLPRPTDSRTD